MPLTTVSVEHGEGWALLTLRAESGLNRLGRGTLMELTGVVSGLLADSGLRCLGITGVGASFAVGADLNQIRRLEPHSAREFSGLGNNLFRMLEQAHAVTVAGIGGYCLGGGFDLALSVDWRLASDAALFGHPGADLGLITGWGGTQRLPRLVGRARALDLLSTGRRVGAGEAHDIGLVQERCREAELAGRLRQRLEFFARSDGAAAGIKDRMRIAG